MSAVQGDDGKHYPPYALVHRINQESNYFRFRISGRPDAWKSWVSPLVRSLTRDVLAGRERSVKKLLISYDAVVIDRERGKTYPNYRAVNILGRVSCADLKQSVHLPGFDPPLLKFERLVIDESRTMGLPLFRLAESVQFILIPERVKQAIEAAPLAGVRGVSLDGVS